MDVLQYLLDSLRSRGPLLFMGDFNARCGAGDDRVNPAVDELVEQIGVVSELRRAHRAALPPRAAVADQVTNNRGVELTTFMQVEDVVLLNGRVAGVGNGGYTYHATKGVPGSSTPDLCLVTADMFEQWGNHVVLDVGPQHLHPDFDHLPLILTLSSVAEVCMGPALAAPGAASKVAGDALWCDEDMGLPPDWYEQVMGAPPSHKPSFRSTCLPEYVAYMQTVLPELDALLSNPDPTVVVGTLQQHLHAASQDSMPWVPVCPAGGRRVLSPLERAAQVDWYTADLAQLRKQLGQVWRNQGVQSAEYGHLSRVYKSRCRSAKRDAQLQHTQEVYNLIRAAPRKFWQQYFKGRKQGPERHMPDATSWAAYGQQLYADPHPGARPVLLGLTCALQGVDADAAEVMLDAPCTQQEMTAALAHLKSGKAADVYDLRAEYLTSLRTKVTQADGKVVTEFTLSKHLAHAFNVCLNTGCLPPELSWGKGCPLHKSGAPSVHDNYRVITIEPVLAKVFSAIMQQRASQYLESHQLRVPEQCGFRRQRSCADQLFVLDHIIRKYQAQGIKITALFVDFRKAFDSVP
jgi:hypothetical protein